RLIEKSRRLSAAEIADHPIIVTHTRSSHLLVLVEGWFRDQGVRPRQIIGCNSMATVIELTRSGLGLGVFPPVLVREDLSRGRIVAVSTRTPLPRSDFVAAYPAEATSPATAAVVALSLDVAGRHPAFNR
ncbi:MAG: hypothetical protein FJX57_08810, partial [Alphaproteobacteria bacterium]|nr:hypothetical protein [Alphaproteobacteria bacterium]